MCNLCVYVFLGFVYWDESMASVHHDTWATCQGVREVSGHFDGTLFQANGHPITAQAAVDGFFLPGTCYGQLSTTPSCSAMWLWRFHPLISRECNIFLAKDILRSVCFHCCQTRFIFGITRFSLLEAMFAISLGYGSTRIGLENFAFDPNK